MVKNVLGFVLAFAVSSTANAIEILNQETSRIGSHNGQTIFLYVKSNALTQQGCVYSVLYCPSTNQDCKSMLSVALAARAVQSKEVNIAFNKESGNVCTMTHISF